MRLIDGLLRGDGELPSSTEVAGTSFYMAPEVSFAGDKKYGPPPPYGAGADWWTFGVLLYELTEQDLPYGDDPEFLDHDAEWRPYRSAAATAKTAEASRLRDLIGGLLTWDMTKRLGYKGGAADILYHPYFADGQPAGAGPVEWDLVGGRLLPSPLKPIVREKAAAQAERVLDKSRAERLKEKESVAVATATMLARAEALEAGGDGADAAAAAAAAAAAVVKSGGKGGGGKGGGGGGGEWTRTRTGRNTASMGRFKDKGAAAAAAATAATGETRLAPLRTAGRVDGWDFASRHAIAQEYVESQAVSLV